jgi:hypothetical protein
MKRDKIFSQTITLMLILLSTSCTTIPTSLPTPTLAFIPKETPVTIPPTLTITPNLANCIQAPLGIENPLNTPEVSRWIGTHEPEIAKAAPNGTCIEMGGEKFIKHTPGMRININWTWSTIWAPEARTIIFKGDDWTTLVIGTGKIAPINRQGDKLYPHNSTIPVLQDIGNDNYITLINFYENLP